MDLSAPQRAALAAADCEVAFDNLTRQLYATDASLYQIEPLAVAFPRGARQAASVIRAAAEAGVMVIPRGAGTGLTGGALGEGLVVDFSCHNRQITELNLERRTVQVGAGVVLDQLNGFLKPYGLGFGPDVATSSRATLGGMIANNSSGSYTPVYGVTADHVRKCEVVLADGRIVEAGGPAGAGSGAGDWARATGQRMEELIRPQAAEIERRMPAGLTKRWPGYGLDRWVRRPHHLADLLAGSEGTLAAILSAELSLVPLPKQKGLGLVFFASVPEAMRATVELLDLRPAAIEHIDRLLFDQTRGQRAFQAARDLLRLDTHPCEAILLVEFFDEGVPERLEALVGKQLGLRTQLVSTPAQQNLVWNLRKAGLSLITGRPGAAKPVTCIEDAAVPPEHLPEYVEGLKSILAGHGLEVCLYGHAASGLLHVRPVLDLHTAAGVRDLRQVTEEVAALVRQYHGSLCAEHGVGMARTEFMGEHLGQPLLELHRRIKGVFDPGGVFNPGKIIPDARWDYRLDTRLRQGAGRGLHLPFEPVLAFADKDHSFVGNLEQCNGCGGCRKDSPTMCPTFSATGQELMSTRGRANLIRAVLEGRGSGGEGLWRAPELEASLSNCLSCKACLTECPSNVNLSLLKAELLHARHQREGVPWLAQVVSHVDWMGRLGCLAPGPANALLEAGWVRGLMERWLGLAASRPLPKYARERFDHWFERRARPSKVAAASRGPVILWDDTFVRYHEPHIGHAAVAVLEAAGFEVRLAVGRACCGRPAMSQGHLGEAARLGRHNLALLNLPEGQSKELPPILFLEPSCWSMFVEDYRELKLPGAESVARRCFLFEDFLDQLLARDPAALRFQAGGGRVVIHAHCHAKALSNPVHVTRLAGRLPGWQVELLPTGCCGMAGAFGNLASKQALSRAVAEPLLDQLQRQPAGTQVVASGTSCRHQIGHLSPVRPRHLAELLAQALEH